MSNVSKPTFNRLRTWSAFVYVLSMSALGAEEANYPRIPLRALENYEVRAYQDIVEAMAMERVRITGTKDIIFDPVPGMRLSKNAPGSVRFFHRSAPQLSFEILSFPSNQFLGEVNAATLSRYLEGRAQYFANDDFTVLEAPVVTTGPAKFRLFGERALTLRYAFDTEQGRMVRGENWLEKDGMIHVIVVDGSPELFNNHFKQVKAGLNSMTYVQK